LACATNTDANARPQRFIQLSGRNRACLKLSITTCIKTVESSLSLRNELLKTSSSLFDNLLKGFQLRFALAQLLTLAYYCACTSLKNFHIFAKLARLFFENSSLFAVRSIDLGDFRSCNLQLSQSFLK